MNMVKRLSIGGLFICMLVFSDSLIAGPKGMMRKAVILCAFGLVVYNYLSPHDMNATGEDQCPVKPKIIWFVEKWFRVR